MLPLHLHLPITTPGLASRHLSTLQILMLNICYMYRHKLHSVLPGHMTLVTDSALDAIPSRGEIATVVEKLRKHKAGTEEGI